MEDECKRALGLCIECAPQVGHLVAQSQPQAQHQIVADRHHVRVGYMAQEQEGLDSSLDALMTIRAVAPLSETDARNFLHYFLLKLSGVARKTANVVRGVCFGLADGVVVDTHVRRISQRLGLTKEEDPTKIEQDLMQILPQSKWIQFSHQVIWHGQRVCDAKRPKCEACVLNEVCPAGKEFVKRRA